jgi:hypothetical protein
MPPSRLPDVAEMLAGVLDFPPEYLLDRDGVALRAGRQ